MTTILKETLSGAAYGLLAGFTLSGWFLFAASLA